MYLNSSPEINEEIFSTFSVASEIQIVFILVCPASKENIHMQHSKFWLNKSCILPKQNTSHIMKALQCWTVLESHLRAVW